MNRPKKNKITNPTLPEDQQDLVDERNLVDAAESEDISFEDRINMYWMENKAFVAGCVFLLALVIIGFNGMRIYKSYAEEQLQLAYAESMASQTLAEFAEANSNKSLGGLAAITVADTAYEAGDFERAGKFYQIGASALQGNILEGRALLGQAFAQFKQGNESAALAQLADIAANSALPEAARSEAAYHLAIEADVAGRSEEFETYVAQIQASPLAGQWQQRIMMYQQQAR